MNAFKQLFTGKDGLTHDMGRWSWAICIATVIVAAFGNWWHNQVIDLVQLATALAAVVGVHGAALWAKRSTEPDPKDTP